MSVSCGWMTRWLASIFVVRHAGACFEFRRKHLRRPEAPPPRNVNRERQQGTSTGNVNRERQQRTSTESSADSRGKAQSSSPPKRKRRQSVAPPELSAYDGCDPYDGATPLPPRPSRTRAKSGKSSSFNVLPIIAVLGVVLLLGGAGFGVWKQVQLIPEDFGKSKSLLGQPRGQYGPFSLLFPDSASKTREKEVQKIAGSEHVGLELRQMWLIDGKKIHVSYFEFGTMEISYPTDVVNHLRATVPSDVIQTWCEVEMNFDKRIKFQWAAPEVVKVNGLELATIAGSAHVKTGVMRQDFRCTVFCCRVRAQQIAIYQFVEGDSDPTPFEALKKLSRSLTYNTDFETANE